MGQAAVCAGVASVSALRGVRDRAGVYRLPYLWEGALPMSRRDRIYTVIGWLVLLVLLAVCGLMCVPNNGNLPGAY